MRLFRPALISITRPFFSRAISIARLHQHGPAQSAVVHEQTFPQTHSHTQLPPAETTSSSIPSSKPHAQPNQQPPQNDPSTLETIISQIPLVQALRASPKTYKESRPHLTLPPSIRQHHFVGGSLTGSGKLALAPYMWTSSRKNKSKGKSKSSEDAATTHASSVISAFHIGRDLCGHPGFVHGGLLSVLFDEVFARCVSAAFPSGLGMTANLNVDFRKPALPGRMYVLRAETVKIEGRKAWVEGRITCLPLSLAAPLGISKSVAADPSLLEEESEGAVMVAEAKALFVEPKFASVSSSFGQS